MTVKEEKPITMAEVVSLVGASDKAEEIKKFIKHFNSLSLDKALKLKEELNGLNLIKLKEAHIVKIIDFLPKDNSELNKILSDVSLDQEEVSKILDVVGKHS